jgi:hypothetical protein
VSKYDKERISLGLKPLGDTTVSSFSANTTSKYAAEREKLKSGGTLETQPEFKRNRFTQEEITEFTKPIQKTYVPMPENIGYDIIPRYKEDKPLESAGKNIVNYGLGTVGRIFNAPSQAIMQTVTNIGNVAQGKPLDFSEKNLMRDILPSQVGQGINTLAQKGPVGQLAAGAATAAIEGGLDPATYIGGGIVDDLSRAGIVGKAARTGTAENLSVTAQRNIKGLGPGIKTAAKQVDETVQAVNPQRFDVLDVTEATDGTYAYIKNKNTGAEKFVKVAENELPKVEPKTAAESMNRFETSTLPRSQAAATTEPKISEGMKERGFATSARTAQGTPETVAKRLESDPLTYRPTSDEKTLSKVVPKVEMDPDGAYRELLTAQGTGLSRDQFATGELLIKKAFEAGDDKKAYDLISYLAEKATESGQAIQALAMFNRMTPEGILMYAERVVNTANRQLGKGVKEGGFVDPLKKFYKQGQLTDDIKNSIKTKMQEAMKLPEESTARSEKMAEIMQQIADAMPKSPGQKIESFRTLAMLSNPKTWIRNLIGNAAFGTIESTATKPLASLVDRGLALKTRQRSVAGTDFKAAAQGLKEGAQGALNDFRKGIDTSPTRGALELPKGNDFKDIPVLKQLERTVRLGVSGGDRPFYQAAYKDAVSEQLRLHKINTGETLTEATQEMKNIAEEIARYRTYADDSMISKGLTSIKRGMNKIRFAGIGLGDILMKFTRTPANLLARGIDYSPAGLMKGIVDVGRVLSGNTAIQRQAAEGISRGLIGSGIVSGTIALANMGVIRGKRLTSTTANEFEKAKGGGQFTINASALKRLVESGFDQNAAKEIPGDQIITYDWAQPMSIPAGVGANISESVQKKQKIDPLGLIGIAVEGLESGVNTLVEQPVLQNVSRLFKGTSLVDGALAVAQSYPGSFIPAFLQGARYAADESIRDTSGSFAESTIKQVANRLPVLSRMLPQSVDVLGKDRKVSAQTPVGRLLDSALNPSRSTTIVDDNAVQEISRLYDISANGNILPNFVEKDTTISTGKKDEKPVELTPAQRNQYQRILAEEYLTRANKLINLSSWNNYTDDQKVSRLKSIRSKADDAAEIKMRKSLSNN